MPWTEAYGSPSKQYTGFVEDSADAMIATVMDGKGLSGSIRAMIKDEVERFEGFAKPSLATVLVGSDDASELYVSLKHKACQEVGIRSMDYRFPDGTPEGKVIEKIDELNWDDSIHGILVQLPLPAYMGAHRVMEKIRPEKDVDGLNPRNLGLTMCQEHGMLPCTPSGILALFSQYSVDLRGKHAVIINRSPDVGKPLAMLLLNRDATVTICHSKTTGIDGHTSGADVLVSAVGCRPDFIVGEGMVKTGAVVIDAGTNRIGGRVYGDVDFERVVHKASYITPVPGGVGPMTVAMLLRNTLVAASNQARVGLSDLFTHATAWSFLPE